MPRTIGLSRFGATLFSIIEGTHLKIEGVNNIVNGTAIYLLKHQSYRDIWAMGVALHRYVQAYAYYPMKSSLPNWLLEPFGGISIYRSQEIIKILRSEKDENKRRIKKDELREKTRCQFNTLAEIVSQNHKNASIVICAEGHRYKNGVGPLHREGVNMLLAANDLPVVPVGTEYHGFQGNIRIGKPRNYGVLNAENAEELRKELAYLSKCKVITPEQNAPARVS